MVYRLARTCYFYIRIFHLQQVDGNVEASDMSQSDEDKTSAKPTKKVIDINDLIAKPDPFANGMVVKKKWSEGKKYFSFLQLY